MSSARVSPEAHRTPETTSTKVKTSAGTRDQHLAGHAAPRAGRPCERTRPGCDRAANTPLDCTQDRGWDFRFWRAWVCYWAGGNRAQPLLVAAARSLICYTGTPLLRWEARNLLNWLGITTIAFQPPVCASTPRRRASSAQLRTPAGG